MDKTIGILGGGQLAMMLTQAATNLGVKKVIVLDPTPDCPASKVGAEQIVGSFQDELKILNLAKRVDVLTFDIESVNVDALKKAKKVTKVYPDPYCLKIIQNKWNQKNYLKKNDIPIAQAYSISSFPKSWKKFIVKTKTGGYDGKGVWLMNSKKEIDTLLAESGMTENELFVEEYILFKKELAVISFRSEHHKDPVNYPVVETIQTEGICINVLCPTALDQVLRDQVHQITKTVVNSFKTYGVFAVELFLTEDNRILVNEISPRVHNSGHYTIEATNCSQFEQHIRAITGIPTIEPILTMSPIKMTNILATGTEHDFPTSLSTKHTNYHWYNKTAESNFKPKRKIGHVTTKLTLQTTPYPLVYIVMGSSSDLPTLMPAVQLLEDFKIPIKVDVVSAHRSPEWMYKFGKNIESWCGRVIIAAAGGAAHLPGMLASLTSLPVIGVPVPSKHLRGKDSLLSIVEMPDGVPVATVGIGKAKNAAILALKILGADNEVKTIIKQNRDKVEKQRETLF